MTPKTTRHPLELSERHFAMNKDMADMKQLRMVQGQHAPLKIQMEKMAVSQVGHLPCITQRSNLHADLLSGKDEAIAFEDNCGKPENFERMTGLPRLELKGSSNAESVKSEGSKGSEGSTVTPKTTRFDIAMQTDPLEEGEDQSSTDTYDSVWDMPALAPGASWRPAMSSTKLSSPASKEEGEVVMLEVKLSIEELTWEWEMSENASTHRGSDDGLEDDL